jgi:hypothetical protein
MIKKLTGVCTWLQLQPDIVVSMKKLDRRVQFLVAAQVDICQDDVSEETMESPRTFNAQACRDPTLRLE